MRRLGSLARERFAVARSGAPAAPLADALARAVQGRREAARTYPWLDGWIEEAARSGSYAAGALERGRAAARGEAVVVLAGQQPALWGGPLYTFYKMLSAVATAEWIEARLRVPAVAVFWMVGDDADFGEVATTWFPAADGRPVKVRDEDLPPSGTRIGTLPASRQARVLPTLSAAWAPQPHAAWMDALGATIAERARTWSEMQSHLLTALAPETPLLVLDGDDPRLLDAARSFLLAAPAADLPSLLEEGARAARAVGLDPAFERELGGRALFRVLEDRREPWTSGDPPARVAPNVVLRPLMQDHMLPNVATICGPSEITYRMQLGPVYRALSVPEPVRLPRLAAVLVPAVPAGLISTAADEWGEYRALLADPAAFVERCVEAAHPRTLLAEAEDLRGTLRSRLAELAGEASGYDASLPQLIESAAGKADYQLGRIEEGFLGKARQRTLRAHPLLAGLSELVAPRGKEQERVLSLLTPFLTEGPAAARVLHEDARQTLTAFVEDPEPRLGATVFLLEGWNEGGKS